MASSVRVRVWESGFLVEGLDELPVAVIPAPGGGRAGVSPRPGELAFVTPSDRCTCGRGKCRHRQAVAAVRASHFDPFRPREPAVLFLEPEVPVLLGLGDQYRARGYRVVKTASLAAALTVYPRLLPDVVLVAPEVLAEARVALRQLDPEARVEAGRWRPDAGESVRPN